MSSNLLYQFSLPDGKEISYPFEFDGERYNLITTDLKTPPWAELSFQQCHHCPYQDSSSPKYCPAALQLAQVVKGIDHLVSFDRVHVRVETSHRIVEQESSAQEAISSLLGLVLASSGCPHTEFLLPMARFHMPLASSEETLWRTCASFMLAQYFRKENGETPEELSGLLRRYDNLETLNSYLAKRLRSQLDQDACLNAIILLDTYAKSLPHFISKTINNLKPLYATYLLN